MATVTVDPNTSYQTWKGWEATAQAAEEFLTPQASDTPQYPSTSFANYKANLLSAMLDVGINRLRLEVLLSDWNATGYSPLTPPPNAIQPTTSTSGQRHFDRFLHAMDSYGTDYRSMLASQGESLWLTLCIVDFASAGYAAELTPSEYSFFVVKCIQAFYSAYGYLPNAIEAILEPDAGTNTNWTATRVANNIVQADADLIAAGYTGIRWIAPSTTQGPSAQTFYAAMKTANASVTALIDEVSYHRYVDIDNATLSGLRTTAEADGNSPAMLEWIGATHLTLYDDLITGHGTSWQQYTLTFPYTGSFDDTSQYFYVDQTGGTPYPVVLNSRTKYLRHYFKYIRPGAVMKGVSNSSGSSYAGVPFRNSNGTYVVPIKCTTSGTIDVAGLPAGTYGIRYTTGNGSAAPSAYDQTITNQTITAGQSVTFTMPAAGVATVYDVNYMVQPPPPFSVGGRGARSLLFRR